MESLKKQQKLWEKHRTRLESEIRVLVVEADAVVRRSLDGLLFRNRIPARSVASAEQAIDLVERERYSVVIAAEVLPGMRGLALTRQLRVSVPHVDVLLTTSEPTVELMQQAFAMRLLDVLIKPFEDLEDLARRIRTAVRRNVDQLMRSYVLDQLRGSLLQLDPDARLRTTAALERRLLAFKSFLGNFDRVLVIEREDADLRQLSENLLLAGLHVETVDNLADGLQRIAQSDICLAVIDRDPTQSLSQLLGELRTSDPHMDVVLVSSQPTVEDGITALRGGVAAYVPWPPEAPTQLVLMLRDRLRRSRKDRLVDNLFLELYRETNRVLDPDLDTGDFDSFRRLIGLHRVLAAPSGEYRALEQRDDRQTEPLTDVLSDVLIELDDTRPTPESDDAAAGAIDDDGSERRIHARVAESQFVRVRARGQSSNRLAFIGDLSEGGLFVRSDGLLSPGTLVELDFNVELDDQAYLVRCVAQVAWVARDQRQSPLGPGFGVRFIHAPEDVVQLLRKIVERRMTSTSAG